MEKLNVISLFDGISCGQLALERAYPKINEIGYNYYASEIKKNGIRVAKYNYPNTIHIGDVTKIDYYNNHFLKTEKDYYECADVFLLIGGSPCQDLSFLSFINDKKKEVLKELNHHCSMNI